MSETVKNALLSVAGFTLGAAVAIALPVVGRALLIRRYAIDLGDILGGGR